MHICDGNFSTLHSLLQAKFPFVTGILCNFFLNINFRSSKRCKSSKRNRLTKLLNLVSNQIRQQTFHRHYRLRYCSFRKNELDRKFAAAVYRYNETYSQVIKARMYVYWDCCEIARQLYRLGECTWNTRAHNPRKC